MSELAALRASLADCVILAQRISPLTSSHPITRTNDIPDSSHQEVLQANLHESQNSMALIRSLIDKFEVAETALYSLESEVKAQLNGCKGALSLIRVLPPELLIKIFQFCSDGTQYGTKDPFEIYEGEAPWTLSRVCSQWRSIVIGTAAIWRAITVPSLKFPTPRSRHMGLEMLQAALQHSYLPSVSPSDISLELYGFETDILPILRRCQSRVTTLILHDIGYYEIRRMGWESFARGFSSITSLSISLEDNVWFDGAPRQDGGIFDSSNITTLSISCRVVAPYARIRPYYLSCLGFPGRWPSLTRFEGFALAPVCIPIVLSSAPALTHLTMVVINNDNLSTSTIPIVFPILTHHGQTQHRPLVHMGLRTLIISTLDLNHPTQHINHILSHITLPLLEHLELLVSVWPSALCTFLDKSAAISPSGGSSFILNDNASNIHTLHLLNPQNRILTELTWPMLDATNSRRRRLSELRHFQVTLDSDFSKENEKFIGNYSFLSSMIRSRLSGKELQQAVVILDDDDLSWDKYMQPVPGIKKKKKIVVNVTPLQWTEAPVGRTKPRTMILDLAGRS